MAHLKQEEYIKILKEETARVEKILWDWYGHADCPEELANKTPEELLDILKVAVKEKPQSGQPHSELFRALRLLKMKIKSMEPADAILNGGVR